MLKQVILWEICARETPYKELKGPHAIMKYVTVDKGRPSLMAINSETPEKVIKLINFWIGANFYIFNKIVNLWQFLELMQMCWDNDPDRRPKMDEVIQILKNIKTD